MKRIKFLALILCFFMATKIQSLAQSKLALELKVGGGSTAFEFEGNFPDLAVSTGNESFVNLIFMKSLKKGFSYGFELDYYRFNVQMRYLPLGPISKNGGAKNDFWGFGPKVQRDLKIVPKGGLTFGTGLFLNYNTQEDYDFQGGELQILRMGNGEPRVPVRIYGKREVNSFYLIFRPEFGLYYDVSSNSRLTFTTQYGFNLNQPSTVIDLSQIEFDGQEHQNKYTYNGNYFSALLGYRFSF